jgi:hypothetical protein
MIVVQPGCSGLLTGSDRPPIEWKSLARRGMLFSECEAIDLLALPPGTELDDGGPDGIEKVWFAVSGHGDLDSEGCELPLRSGDLVLSPADVAIRVRAGAAGLELLLLAVTPSAVSAALPARTPVA